MDEKNRPPLAPTARLNLYMDEDLNRKRLTEVGHRGIVGGLWDVIGPLQRDFLIGQGLRRDHRLLDIGCGALRGGVPLATWLDPNRYYGIDISASLIEAGYDAEVAGTPLAERLPRAHLHVTDDFEAPFGETFDMGLAVSLFTHLPADWISRALGRLTPHFAGGAPVFATVFERPASGGGDLERPDGVVTHDDRDPYHFTRDQVREATPDGWRFDWIGDWGHPRDQQMARFTRL
jgi:hypothetical protein